VSPINALHERPLAARDLLKICRLLGTGRRKTMHIVGFKAKTNLKTIQKESEE
jgi:hypothetical protein